MYGSRAAHCPERGCPSLTAGVSVMWTSVLRATQLSANCVESWKNGSARITGGHNKGNGDRQLMRQRMTISMKKIYGMVPEGFRYCA